MYGFRVKFVNTRTEILGRPIESEMSVHFPYEHKHYKH